MRRSMIPRTVWLALSTAVAAAMAAVMVLRSRRRAATEQQPAQQQDEGEPAAGTPSAPPASAPDPGALRPVPILGNPTENDLKRYATRPSFLDRPATRVRPPREPLSVAGRRRLTRWGAAGCALVLLACGAQALESVVFSSEPATETPGPSTPPLPGFESLTRR
ncbi:hypothetical protein [Nonomuraea sp. NPDC002799]